MALGPAPARARRRGERGGVDHLAVGEEVSHSQHGARDVLRHGLRGTELGGQPDEREERRGVARCTSPSAPEPPSRKPRPPAPDPGDQRDHGRPRVEARSRAAMAKAVSAVWLIPTTPSPFRVGGGQRTNCSMTPTPSARRCRLPETSAPPARRSAGGTGSDQPQAITAAELRRPRLDFKLGHTARALPGWELIAALNLVVIATTLPPPRMLY